MEVRDFRIALKTRQDINYQEPVFAINEDLSLLYEEAKILAHTYNKKQKKAERESYISAANLHAAGILHLLYQNVVTQYLFEQDQDFFTRLTPQITRNHSSHEVLIFFAREFPSPILHTQQPTAPYLMEETARGFFIHHVMLENPALLRAVKPFVKPEGIQFPAASVAVSALMGGYTKSTPRIGEHDEDLFSFLTNPAKTYPDSLIDQINYILRHWKEILPGYLKTYLLRALDYIQEEEKPRFAGGGPGPITVPAYGSGTLEYEAYSADQNWMPNVVMLAKSTLVWLDQLSRSYGSKIETLDQIPDHELDLIAQRGFTGLWLIGLWERSAASKRIKNLSGNAEAEASAYSLKSYDIATNIGGWAALHNLDLRCKARGIRLASDMVPNHTGLDSDWVLHHPEYFIQSQYPPFPSYTYNGEDLSPDPEIEIKIEDHYFDRSDAAVTFRRVDKKNQTTSYIFHGNDGTSMPWNDTAQLDFLNPNTREAVMQQILHVARNFHIIRFDAAMTLAKKHVQRLWYPQPGSGGDIPGRTGAGLTDEEFFKRMPHEFWREVVDRVAKEVPDTLLLAEAFWMMEGYFVRTLGMHRVYNSAFMHMLKDQENQKYRDTIKNTISFDPEILKRFVNFMSNPDEETAIGQFGNGDKYFGVCTLLATMPGLPMFGHGQIEGFKEKYGMEYSRAYWNEYPDDHLVAEHYRRIFPLLEMRHLFSGVNFFDIFDVIDNQSVVESIFAYTNGIDARRVLVLYNNQYEHAQGRITKSAPKMVRLTDTNRVNRSQTLGESLGLSIGGRRFMIYENFLENLTYIVPSMMIFDEGLWVSLAGYETKIWLNIREVEDFDGAYEALYHKLGGKGTHSFERDLAIIRLQPLYKALENFRSPAMLKTIRKIVAGKNVSGKEIRSYVLLAGEAYARLLALYETLSQTVINTIPALAHEVQPRALLKVIQNLINCFSAGPPNSTFSIGGKIMVELPILIQAALVMKTFISPTMELEELIAIVEALHLDAYFSEVLDSLQIPEETGAELVRKAAFLANPLGQVLTAIKENSKNCLAQLFEEPEFRRAVGYNEYQNVAWYRKESFQETIFIIALGVCIHEDSLQESMQAMLTIWLKSDLKSEYKVQNLLANVTDKDE